MRGGGWGVEEVNQSRVEGRLILKLKKTFRALILLSTQQVGTSDFIMDQSITAETTNSVLTGTVDNYGGMNVPAKSLPGNDHDFAKALHGTSPCNSH